MYKQNMLETVRFSRKPDARFQRIKFPSVQTLTLTVWLVGRGREQRTQGGCPCSFYVGARLCIKIPDRPERPGWVLAQDQFGLLLNQLAAPPSWFWRIPVNPAYLMLQSNCFSGIQKGERGEHCVGSGFSQNLIATRMSPQGGADGPTSRESFTSPHSVTAIQRKDFRSSEPLPALWPSLPIRGLAEDPMESKILGWGLVSAQNPAIIWWPSTREASCTAWHRVSFDCKEVLEDMGPS